jgi:hypothetical protein
MEIMMRKTEKSLIIGSVGGELDRGKYFIGYNGTSLFHPL